MCPIIRSRALVGVVQKVLKFGTIGSIVFGLLQHVYPCVPFLLMADISCGHSGNHIRRGALL